MSILSLAIEGSANLTALRSLRTLRALRPLRAISRWQGMKVSVSDLHIFDINYANGFFFSWLEKRAANLQGQVARRTLCAKKLGEISVYTLTPALVSDRSQCLDVRHSLHYQCLTCLPGILAHFFHHGCAIFWWEILQMPR